MRSECAPKIKPTSQVDVVEDALELWVWREEALLRAEDPGTDGEDGDVGSDEDKAEGVGEGVDVEGDSGRRSAGRGRSRMERMTPTEKDDDPG